jgi:hypothetical protein
MSRELDRDQLSSSDDDDDRQSRESSVEAVPRQIRGQHRPSDDSVKWIPRSPEQIKRDLAAALALPDAVHRLFPRKTDDPPYSSANPCHACGKSFVKAVSRGKDPDPIICSLRDGSASLRCCASRCGTHTCYQM